MTPRAQWLRFTATMVFVARNAHQSRESIRAMPLSTFLAWAYACEDLVSQEQSQ